MTTSDGSSRSTTRMLSARNRLQAGLVFAAEPADDLAAQVEHVVGPLAKRLVFERLKLLIPALKHPAHGRFGRQQRSSQLALEFARSEQIAQHRAVGAKDAGQRRIEFGLDALGVLLEVPPAFPRTSVASGTARLRLRSAESCADAAVGQHIADDPGPPHAQARRDAPPGERRFRLRWQNRLLR